MTSEFSILVVAETRQKAGTSVHEAAAAPPRPCGGTNAPAGTLWVEAMVVLGSEIAASALHGLDDAAGPCAADRTSPATGIIAATITGIRETRKADERYLNILPPFEPPAVEFAPTPAASAIVAAN
jgi:hypothetical protein